MLISEYSTAECGITVPYDQSFEGVRRNFGFVDLRGRPDLVARVPEAAESNSLRALLVSLSAPDAAVFTLGCDLGARDDGVETPNRYTAGGYVQVMRAAFADTTGDDYLDMARAVSAHLEAPSEGHDWQVTHVYASVDFRLGRHFGIVPSLEIWFDARADGPAKALQSREKLIAALDTALTTSS